MPYKDDVRTPVFAWNKNTHTSVQLVHKLLRTYESEQTCISQPINVSQNVSFFVDTRSLEHKDDLKCDDMGAWQHKGSPKCCFKVSKSSRGITNIVKIQTKSKQQPTDDVYTLKRVYYRNIRALHASRAWRNVCFKKIFGKNCKHFEQSVIRGIRSGM